MLISDRLKKKMDLNTFPLHPDYSSNDVTMNIEISSKCNQLCIYCIYSTMGVHSKGKFIDEDLFYRLTKEAYELGIRNIGLYSAGEPLLNPKIYDYIRYLKELGFSYVYVSTNGILCTPENFKKLIDAGIDSVKFTISSCERENYKRHHGVDSFELVKNNIEFAGKYRRENSIDVKLFIFTVLTKYNQHEKEDITKMFGEYVDEILFTNVVDGVFSMKGLKEYLYVDKSDYFLTGGDIKLPCHELFNRVNVDVDGYLCVCCLINHDMTKIADLNKVSLDEGLNGKEFVELRQRHLNGDISNTICNRCINNIKEMINPLSSDIGVKAAYIDDLDRVDEIEKRFNIV